MNPTDILIAGFERASSGEGAESIDAWVKASNLFCEVSSTPLKDFLNAEDAINQSGGSAVDLISNLAALSFSHHQEKKIYSSLLRLTDLTGLAALRFTSAWLAFNMNDFSACITECEKIDDCGYQIYGLMGQAHLENGQPQNAVNSLKIALAMNDSDPAIWFQLAKAYFVMADSFNAWDSLTSCEGITGPNAEIAILKIAIAISACEAGKPESSEWHKDAIATVRSIFDSNENKALLVLYVARLALFCPTESQFIEEIAWFPCDHRGLDVSTVTIDVSLVLKNLQKKAWFRGAAALLGLLTGASIQGSPAGGSSTPA
jgi:hypothetical protein